MVARSGLMVASRSKFPHGSSRPEGFSLVFVTLATEVGSDHIESRSRKASEDRLATRYEKISTSSVHSTETRKDCVVEADQDAQG